MRVPVQHSEAWWGVRLAPSDTGTAGEPPPGKGRRNSKQGICPQEAGFRGCSTNITLPLVSSVSFAATQKKAARRLGTLGEVT